MHASTRRSLCSFNSCGSSLFGVFMEASLETEHDTTVRSVSNHFIYRSNDFMRRIKGSFTVEAAVIVPLIVFIFGVLLHILFYWHDKNILISTAHETAVFGSGRDQISEIELEYYFFSRMEEKLLLFNRVECVSYIEEDKVRVVFDGSRGQMVAKGMSTVSRTDPEGYIRNVRKLKKLGEGIGK